MTQEDLNDIISKSTPDWLSAQVRSEADCDELQRKYNELVMAVSRKFPGETRHQTALRYIRQAEDNPTFGPCQAE
ncbi:MAG TPA: hypothetical protein DCS09_04735 [Porphyromonadaceae bacterium]|nr:hypothetical protein [Porphyromonadaceae bacterium]